MKLLVIGQTGQLARALNKISETGDIEAKFMDRHDLDLTQARDDMSSILKAPLDWADGVILAAAYTDVERAEDDYDTALLVNAIGPEIIASEANKRHLPIVFISSDYVFGGQAREPYSPDAPMAPMNAYGRSKTVGEHKVYAANEACVILRTSWVYDGVGRNFLTKMMALAKTHPCIHVVCDQFGRPTYSHDLAAACVLAIKSLCHDAGAFRGVYHVTGSGDPISWADFAESIFQESCKPKVPDTRVKRVSSGAFPTKALRPVYSVLDISGFEKTFSMALPHWRDGLTRAMQAYKVLDKTDVIIFTE